MVDICIIGGGAAGMTAAICAKEENPKLDVLIIEKKSQMGKKLLATGNGKCNLSNINCPGVEETLDFFEDLGIVTRTDSEGRIYPYTEEARSVKDALEQRLRGLGVQVMTDAEVAVVEHSGDHFIVQLGNKVLEARKLLIACGGKSAAKLGSSGDGFRFAKKLGHKVSKLIPVLTAVDVKEDTSKLSGIRTKACVSLNFNGQTVFSERGEVQFTQTGISGICVFNLSRFLMIPEGCSWEEGFDQYEILIDLFPDRDDLVELLEKRREQGFADEKLLQFLVRRPLGEMIYTLSKGDIKETARLLKAFPLSPKSVKGWEFAQATKGGVSFDEINEETMESRIIKNLYFAGEVLDYDGPCGGYNLQNAWETGRRAGKEMAK